MHDSRMLKMTPSVVLSRGLPATYRKGTPQSSRSLRPHWDVILSILRDSELNDTQRLFVWI